MQPGLLRTIAEFQQEIETRDAAGGIVLTWSKFLTRFAELKTGAAAERFVGQRDITESDIVLLIRSDPYTKTLTNKHRVEVSGVQYNIRSIQPVSQLNRTLIVKARLIE